MPRSHAFITIGNACERGELALEVTALVDATAWEMRIPQRVCDQLKLTELSARSTTLADGRKAFVPYVGVFVACESRRGFTGALVCGEEVVLGTLALQELNFMIDPATGKLVANQAPTFMFCVGGVQRGRSVRPAASGTISTRPARLRTSRRGETPLLQNTPRLAAPFAIA